MLVLHTERMALLALDPRLAALQAGSRTSFFNAIAAMPEAMWPPAPFEQSSLDWAAKHLAHDPEGEGWYGWAMLANGGERQPPRCVGIAALIGRPDEDGDVELAFGVAPEFIGRGFNAEAVRALARWAIANGARRVLVHCDAEDVGVAHVLEKSGFADTNEPPYPGVARWALASA
ncbi:MAG: GNAT family N-acetyltransferase [Hyphomonadaceae bacterium]|nr:GNAT family N-acetyltransferase [Hyphomonadaceae bacterium]